MRRALNEMVTQQEFAEMVGITQPRVAQLLSDDVLPRDGTLGAWLLAYFDRLREQAAGRGLELTIERAALTKAQRIAQDMKNAIALRQYAPAGLLDAVLARVSAVIAGRMDALSAELPQLCPGLDEAARAVVLATLASARAQWLHGTASLSEASLALGIDSHLDLDDPEFPQPDYEDNEALPGNPGGTDET